MEEKLLSIGEAAKAIGVSIDTLRRWDKKGTLRPVRTTDKSHRYYRKNDIEFFLHDIFELARRWSYDTNYEPGEPKKEFYCSNKAVFQIRLEQLQSALSRIKELENIFPLIVAVAGEIGNNSFDHNLGNWPDIPGIFFAYDLNKKHIVLADRGRGILKTLKRVRVGLSTHEEALRVAFTEIISGRAPEERGNGLKFVRNIVTENPLHLFFQTGTAALELHQRDNELCINTVENVVQGCLALITFTP